MVPNPAAVSLEDSVRYVEGQREREAFADFRTWALTSAADAMLAQINRPIVPGFGQVIDE